MGYTGRYRAGPLIVPCPCRHYGPNWQPQALALRRAVPGTGTIVLVPCRPRTVLFRTVLVPAHRVSAKWPCIIETYAGPYLATRAARRCSRSVARDRRKLDRRRHVVRCRATRGGTSRLPAQKPRARGGGTETGRALVYPRSTAARADVSSPGSLSEGPERKRSGCDVPRRRGSHVPGAPSTPEGAKSASRAESRFRRRLLQVYRKHTRTGENKDGDGLEIMVRDRCI